MNTQRKRIRGAKLAVATGLGVLGITGAALAHEGIAVSWTGNVYTINPHDGTGVLLNGNTGWSGFNAMAKGPDGVLYASSSNSLLTVDPNDGSITLRATMPANINSLRGMAFHPDGRLFAFNDESITDFLYEIDPDTGAATLTGQASHTAIQGFAIDSLGNAYAWDVRGQLGGLLTVDLNTGATANVGGQGGDGGIQSLSFDSADQLLGIRDSLYTINTGDGSFTLIGSGGYSDVRGMEIAPAQSAQYSLRISGACPGRLTIDWANADQDVLQAIVFGNNLGQTTIPQNFPCAGTVLGLSGNVQLVDPPGFFSTGSGIGSISGQVGTAACGHYLQLVQGSDCAVSNTDIIPN